MRLFTPTKKKYLIIMVIITMTMLFNSQQIGGAEICVGESFIRNTTYEKLLGVKIDHNLNCDDHLNSIRNRESGKLGALTRVIPYTIDKSKLNINSFFNLIIKIYMLHSR